MTTASLTWLDGQDRTAGSVSATIAMDESAWAAVGATFTTDPDGLGGHVRLALGAIEVDGQPMEFGVLAYEDDDVSHLIVGGLYDARPTLTAQIVDDLLAAGVIPDEDLVLEIIGLAKPASVDDKLDYVVDIVEATVSEAHRTLQEQVRLMQSSIEAILSQRATPDVRTLPVIAPDPSAFNLLPIRGGGIRDLVILRGIAHALTTISRSRSVRPPLSYRSSSAFRARRSTLRSRLTFCALTPPPARPSSQSKAGQGRVPLIIAGLGHSLADFEEISISPVALTVADAYGDRWPNQQAFDLFPQSPGPKSPPRRRIRFRITS
jgi:hypothetical protein